MREAVERDDPLGEALHFLRMSGIFYTRTELAAPWGLEIPALPGCASFHMVTQGGGWLDVESPGGPERRRMGPGDLVLLCHGSGHRLVSGDGVPTPRADRLPHEEISPLYRVLRHGGGGEPTHMICGGVRFDHPAALHLVELLPPVLHLKAGGPGRVDWLSGTLRLMAEEAREARPGGETVITRLADILVIQAIRAWLDGDPAARTGWLGALKDPKIGRAVAAVHRDPARPWTVASLAAEAAMSRSAFAARFHALVGEPPLRYVGRWRMRLATAWLREEHQSAAEVAARLGYQSEAAFRRAFKRHIGAAPGAVRRGAAAPPAVPQQAATATLAAG